MRVLVVVALVLLAGCESAIDCAQYTRYAERASVALAACRADPKCIARPDDYVAADLARSRAQRYCPRTRR